MYDAHRQGVYLYIAMNNLPEARKAAIKAHEIEANNPKTDLLFMDIAWEEGRDGEVIKRANSVI